MPSTLVLSHAEQLDRLRESCPAALDRALIAGDPCFDRLLDSFPWREHYRHSFGLRPGQRLVVVSSTWGRSSLFGQDPALVTRIAARLPLDDYRVVLALHPNIWQGHSAWQLDSWLESCTRSGVRVLPPHEGWRAALIAGDVTIGDHGSVPFYSAALGSPLLLATRPADAVDPRSPIGRLLAAAPGLSASHDPRAQLERAIEEHRPDRYAAITGLTTSAPGKSARILRTAMYSWLELPEPAEPAELPAIPAPGPLAGAPTAQLVHVRLAERDATIVRYPAERLHDPADIPADAHLVVTSAEPYRRWWELAEILVCEEPTAEPAHWIRRTLATWPGTLIATAARPDGTWLAGTSTGSLVECGGAGPPAASMLHAWLAAGRSPDDFPARPRIRPGGP